MKLDWKSVLNLLAAPGERTLTGINLLMVLVVAYSLAGLTWRFVPSPAPLPQPPQTRTETPAAVASTVAGQAIPQWHLFGQYIPDEMAPAPEALPETQLKLTLRGLVASSDPNEALAIVASPSGDEMPYRVGAKLPGNAELLEIHSDSIVLQSRGRRETLRLPKEALDMGGSTAPGIPGASVATGRRPPFVTPHSSGASLGQYKETLKSDPAKLAELVQPVPARRNGKFIGYTLQPGKDPTFLARHGLRPGDIVTSVNGVALDNPSRAFEVMRTLSSATMLDLEVERNGQRQRFSIPLN